MSRMVPLIAVLATLVLGSVSCTHARNFHADLTLLQQGVRSAEAPRQLPFAARYARGSRQLTFVAAEHTYQLDHPTIRLLLRELEHLQPRIVVVEGSPKRSEGISPPRHVEMRS